MSVGWYPIFPLTDDFSAPLKVDFTTVAVHAGYKDAKNAREMWRRLQLKINGSTANNDNDGGKGTSTPKKTRKGKEVETGAAEDDGNTLPFQML